MAEEVAETNPLETTVKALQDQIAGLTGQIEGLKPKPAKSDRDVLDDIASGIGTLADTIGKLTGATGTPPPVEKPNVEKPVVKERKKSIFYR